MKIQNMHDRQLSDLDRVFPLDDPDTFRQNPVHHKSFQQHTNMMADEFISGSELLSKTQQSQKSMNTSSFNDLIKKAQNQINQPIESILQSQNTSYQSEYKQ